MIRTVSAGPSAARGPAASAVGARGVRRVVAIVIVALAALATAPRALAATPPEVAEQLHKKATEAYRAHHLKQAIEFWREAYDTSASWKYAYNLANALREDGRFVQAWDYIGKAEALGVPPDFAGYALELRSFIRAELARDHALLIVIVDPPDALVSRNGAPWASTPDPAGGAPQRELWTLDTESVLEVSREGYVPQRITWKHGLGVQERRVVLRPIPKPGLLKVDGTPVGAVVHVDDQQVGSIPGLELGVEPGRHVIVVSALGYVTARRTVDVASGAELRVDFALKPEVVAPPPSDLATPGWIALGSGAVLVGVGAGFLAWADDAATDLENLNADAGPPGAYGDYSAAYDDLHGDYALRRDTGAALVVLGGVALATGAVLLVLDAGQPAPAKPPEERRVPIAVGVAPAPGGASCTAVVRF
ncbi:MAG: PEGA domain-containing protein [Myxococcales bacterium]|nr:PEGA domain-containing protein [Myxococcales bacterium]MCB9735073.1 PEGA domain-containing protein [Deltaproteobacteria bacterium]